MFPGASVDRMTRLRARLFASCCYNILHRVQTKEAASVKYTSQSLLLGLNKKIRDENQGMPLRMDA